MCNHKDNSYVSSQRARYYNCHNPKNKLSFLQDKRSFTGNVLKPLLIQPSNPPLRFAVAGNKALTLREKHPRQSQSLWRRRWRIWKLLWQRKDCAFWLLSLVSAFSDANENILTKWSQRSNLAPNATNQNLGKLFVPMGSWQRKKKNPCWEYRTALTSLSVPRWGTGRQRQEDHRLQDSRVA